MSADTPAAAPAQHTPPPRPRRRWTRWLLGLLAALLLALAAALAGLWIWAGQEGSLARALQLASRYAPLSASAVTGSLRQGGHIGQLQWQDSAGLRVQAQGIELRWQLRELLGTHLHIQRLAVAQLQITDERPPSTEPSAPAAAPQNLALPLRVSLDDLQLGHAQWGDAADWAVRGLRARYRYDGAQHQLHIPQWQLNTGRYHLRAHLQDQAPLQLELALGGQLSAPTGDAAATGLPLSVQALLHGPLHTLQARLHAQAAEQPAPAQATASAASAAPPASLPELPAAAWASQSPAPDTPGPWVDARAHIQPWAAQPLPEALAQLHALDARALWPSAPRTALSGQLRISPQDGGGWAAQAQLQNTSPGPWDQAQLPLSALQADALWQDGVATVRQLQAQAGAGQVHASGHWAGPQSAQPGWQAQARIQALEPARLHSQLAADALSGHAQASGQGSQLRFEADLQAQTPRARQANQLHLQQLQAQGQWADGLLTLQQLRVHAADAQLQAQAELRLSGDQPPGGQGQLQFSAPGAQLQAQGRLWADSGQGQFKASLSDAARGLAWLRKLPGLGAALAAHSASGSAQLQGQWRGGWQDPTLDAQLNAPALAWWPSRAPQDKLQLRQTSLRLQGRWQQARLSVSAQAQQGQRSLAFEGAAQGGRASGPEVPLAQASWRAQIEPFSLRLQDPATLGDGQWQARSSQAVGLRWSPGQGGLLQADAGQLILQSPAPTAQARLDWAPLRWQAGQLSTSGRLSGLPLQWIERLSGDALRQAGVGGNLTLNGAWDAQLGRALKLQAELSRASGDLTISAQDSATGLSTQVQAGLRQARISLDNQGPQLRLRLLWDSERAGQAQAELRTELAATGSGQAQRWHWPKSAPLQGTLQARLPQVAVWSVLAPPGWRLRGSLSADGRLSGTRAQPLLHGQLQADDLGLRSVVDGVALRDGRLRARLDGQRLLVDELSLRGSGPQGGALRASGAAQWQGGALSAQLRLVFDRLRASIRDDRQLTLSGQVDSAYTPGQVSAEGRLRVDQAQIVLPDESRPSLGSDVRVRGQSAASSAKQASAAPAPRQALQARVNVQLDLGPAFALRGMGIDTRLAGELTLAANGPLSDKPRLSGSVRTEGGNVRAYGQHLQIASGRIQFAGDISNPSLDILALRPNYASEQRVGVRVMGSALLPRISLYSSPALSDSQTLAWLLLGREAPSTGAEAAMLQTAALSLLGGRQSQGLAARFGLDELSFSSGEDGAVASGSLTVGKRLSDKLYAAYEHSLGGATGVLMIFYELSRRLSLRGQAGQTQQAIDLLYHFSYD